MSKRNRVLNCVVLSRLNQPDTVYRWVRRYKFVPLMKRISRLSLEVAKFGNKYVKLKNVFVIPEEKGGSEFGNEGKL